jgi:aminocarboxymuconate-semialdehyde decarboxylase
MTVIDVHAHVIVPELLRAAAPEERWRPTVTDTDGRSVVELAGSTISSPRASIVDTDALVAAQARAGIDRTLLSPFVPLLFCEIEPLEGLRRCRIQNEGLARLRRDRPEQIGALGAVPMQDPRLAAAELEALMSSGDFSGVEVPTSVGGVYLGDPRFGPFWDAAERTRALVFVHPTTRAFDAPVFDQHALWNLVGNPVETTLAAAHLVLSGTIERHPHLNLLLAHGGGAIVALRGRLRRGQAAIGRSVADPSTSTDASIGRLMFDTVVHDPAVLRALVSLVGADRALLGSDYPFEMGDPDPVGTVRGAGLDPSEEESILAANASRLLERTGATTGGKR